MELKRYLGVLRRWIWFVILGAIVAGVVFTAMFLFMC